MGTDRVTRGDFGSLRLAAGPEGLTGRSALGQLRREAVPDRCGAESEEKGRCAAGGQSVDRWTGIALRRTDRPGDEKPVAVVGRGARKPGTLLSNFPLLCANIVKKDREKGGKKKKDMKMIFRFLFFFGGFYLLIILKDDL